MAGQKAPFYVGGPIPAGLAAQYLYGYEEQRRTLLSVLRGRALARTMLTGPPESGRTSLLLAAAGQWAGQRALLDCRRIWPRTVDGYFRLLSDALGLKEPARPSVDIAPRYRALRPNKRSPARLLGLEDVQALARIDPALIAELPALADQLPHHLIVTGYDETHGTVASDAIRLDPFSAPASADFIATRFQTVGMTIDADALPVFHEFSQGQPAILQRLGMAAWEGALHAGAARVATDHVDAAVSEVVERLPPRVLAPWAQLRGLMRDVFVAMCLHDLSRPTQVARRLGLEPKNVVVLLGRLQKFHGLVERVDRGTYQVRNPLLKHYVRKAWSSPILR